MLNPLSKKKQINEYLLSFLLSLLIAFLLFLPFLIIDKGFFIYAGDYNSQQIPFYTYVHHMVKTGQIGYSWVSDLGGSIFNSYSFYLLGSPFFWLLLPFPTRLVPYLMAPLLMLKFAVAGLSSYCFLRRYAKTRNFALVGSVLYAFSSFSIYNIFFNHFIDVIALFPFMLWAMDEFFYENKRGLFAVTVAFNLLNNYYFFTGQVVFLIIYFFAKAFTNEYKITIQNFFTILFEAVVGCFMGILLAIPALMNLIDNPRSINTADGFSLLLYSRVQQYFAIFSSALFSPDPPYMPNLFTDASVKWTSLSAYLPLVSFSGVFAFLSQQKKRKKKSALYHLLIIIIFMSFVPILNSAFHAFNRSYYTRWLYMLIILFSFATMQVLQEERSLPYLRKAIKVITVVTASFAIFGLTPQKTSEGVMKFGLAEDPYRFWLTLFTSLLGLLIFHLFLSQYNKKVLSPSKLLARIMPFIILYGAIHMSLTKFPQWENDALYKPRVYDAAATFSLNDDSFYRVDVYRGEDNMGLHFNIPSIQFFNSVVTPSIMEFYPSVGVKRDVSSKPEIEQYALRGLLSVKYLITPETNMLALMENDKLFGFEYLRSDSGYAIYENTNFVPMAFIYDYYITEEAFESVTVNERPKVLMRAICLSEEQVELYGAFLTELPQEQTYGITFENYIVDCAQRRENAAYSFEASHTGFTADIILHRRNLVFISVPYDEGFTAYVNGVETPIEKVSNGMCAVTVPAGEAHIEFIYSTPGLSLSTKLTIGAWVLWVGYVILNKRIKSNKKMKDGKTTV